MKVVLVRHGETAWNREGRLQGWAPVPLNEKGREQARRLGAAVSEQYTVDRFVASDLCRTRETAAIIRESGVATEPRFDSGWRERDLGRYQGLTVADVRERFPALTVDAGHWWLQERPDGGESVIDTQDRVTSAWERLINGRGRDGRDGDKTLLVVTHGGPMKGIIAHVRGLDLMTVIHDVAVPNCAITEIDVGDDVEIRREAVPPAELFEG